MPANHNICVDFSFYGNCQLIRVFIGGQITIPRVFIKELNT